MAPIRRAARYGRYLFPIAATLVLLAGRSTPGGGDGRHAPRRRPTTDATRLLRGEGRRLEASSDPVGCPGPGRPPPQLPPPPASRRATYAASFPGSGDRAITKDLIEGVTGMFVGEAAVSPSLAKMKALSDMAALADNGGEIVRGQGEVVAVRTHFPHTSGKLASWDDDITRAVVMLRNPLHAIPAYFNQVYELRNHMSPGASTRAARAPAARAAWVEWRSKQLRSQTMLYRRFVSFWMEKYLDHEGDRIYLSYERFVDEGTGPGEAARLAGFLRDGARAGAAGPSGGTSETMADLGDVPCLWREALLPRSAGPGPLEEEARDYDGGDWSPEERPFTPDDLAAISGMLLELINRWSRHQRLLGILSKYHREVNLAYLESTGQLESALEEREKYDRAHPREGQQAPPAGPAEGPGIDAKEDAEIDAESIMTATPPSFHIIQASSSDDPASLVTTNWLMGLFEPQEDVTYLDDWPERPIRRSGRDAAIESMIVTKTHSLDLLSTYKLVRPHFDEVFFVVSNGDEDPGSRASAELCDYKNVLCIERDEFLRDAGDGLQAVVGSLTRKFRESFGYYFGDDCEWLGAGNESNAVGRLEAMARATAGASDDRAEKFGVRGGPRGGAVAKAVAGAGDGGRRRRLSAAPPDGGCEVKWPRQPSEGIQPAYAASYPGCGARMSWNLVEALTGLWTGDDWDNNKRGKRVVTVKTHYPHDAGQLVSWDDEINRALVIIRNPMSAIPSFFNHIYEVKNNLKIHSQRAPIDAWVEWRDRLAEAQIRKYGKFVDYWMERFSRLDGDRIFVSYETLTDDDDGPEEAVRIAKFLSVSKGVEPIPVETVPCIWRAVVKYKKQVSDPGGSGPGDGRRRLDPGHHDSQRSGPTERPYTPQLLDAMSKMLLDLIQRWGDRHLRLRKTLEGYQRDVHAAYLAVTDQLLQASDPPTGGKNFHIVQVSLPHAGTTVLNNLLVGLFDPDADYKKSAMVSITHDFDLLTLYKREKPNYDEIFFVVSNQGTDPSTRVGKEACEYNNVLCIEYEELQYNNQQGLHDVVNNMSNKFQSRFQSYFGQGFLDETKRMFAMKRLEAMDNAVAALKAQPPGVLDAKLGIGGGSVNDAKKLTRFQVNGKSFHIFQASPPHTASAVVTNWLMGLFEPDKDYSFMVNNPEQTVRNHDTTVQIDSTVVTKTHIIDLMTLYKQYRPQFDEIFFVVSNREKSPETNIDASLCQYDNVLCIQYEELLFSDKREILSIVNNLTNKFTNKFEYFFGVNSHFLGEEKVASAVRRLEGMAQVAETLADKPHSVSDSKYGVHGGHQMSDGKVFKGRLFYCGGAHRSLHDPNFKYSTFGLFLAISLFPDFEGDIIIQDDKSVANSAIPLTEDSMKDASGNDLLIVHSHQHCQVSVDVFPGLQLHINSEFYDLHPRHSDNRNGELTFNYLPPGEKSFVLGLHEDTSRSIRVPVCSMRLWYLHMSGQSDLNKLFDPLYKPKNTGENFLLYINSHYIEHRERAARDLSKIGTIHSGGKCQGYFEANPAPPADPNDDSATQCVPFDDNQRPSSIQPISGLLGSDQQRNNMELFSHYRYALVMENTDVPGYISEKILHAFLSGTVPIYFGSRYIFEIFNPKAFIYFDLDIPQQALSQIQFYEQNPSEYDKMLNEPILAHGQETLEKYFSWDESVGNGSLKARIRDMMGLA